MRSLRLILRSSLALAALLFAAACSVDNIDLSGRPCPCAPGWVCDTSTNLCVQNLQTVDAPPGGPDASPGPDAPLFPVDAACAEQIVINEIVVWSQQDWDDSAGGNGIPFDDVPGTGAFDNSSDEWVEIYNASSCALDIRGYRVHFVDGTDNFYEFGVNSGQILRFSAGGNVADFQAGEYLVIGNPGVGGGSSQVLSDVWIHLDDPNTNIVDQVAFGNSTGGDNNPANNAPSGASSQVADEAVARVPNGADSDNDIADWQRRAATIGAAN